MNCNPSVITAAILAATVFGITPASAATIDVLGWNSDTLAFTPCFSGCGINVPFIGSSSLAQATPAGYQGFGFRPGMIYNDATGNPAGSVNASANGLPAHTSLNISFLLAVIDSWDGDTSRGGSIPPDVFNITVDGVSVFSRTFDNFDLGDQTASTANLLSFGSNLGFSSWNDSAYDFTGVHALLNIPHTADSVDIRFFASGAGWQGGGDESFGLDKLLISVNTSNVPEPSSLALLGLGLSVASLALRRRLPS
ncbi:MAG: PEP-CTERM sorting domain-containing protein [Candidatus Accumulibacter phosphatis]|nr:PEP-CTERM sorting domain-containing protein [Candidatus Accumulibacter phosphatis]